MPEDYKYLQPALGEDRPNLMATNNKQLHRNCYTSVAFPAIKADIIAHKKIEVHPEEPQTFDWKGHGFKVSLPAGALSSSRPVTMYLQACLKGEYLFPTDRDLVSGVYCISVHPPVENFNKKVTITLQHCACIEDEEDRGALSFFAAKEAPCL